MYGEIDLAAFVVILREARAALGAGARARARPPARPRRRAAASVPFSLGSGAGARSSAALGAAPAVCVGIEILSSLDEAARVLAKWETLVAPRLGAACAAGGSARAVLRARYGARAAAPRARRAARRRRHRDGAVARDGDAYDDDDDDERRDDRVDDASDDLDWSDGDIVFANSTCFDDELQRALTRRGERLRPGALLISFTTALQTLWFVVVYKRRFEMSWGPATVFIHRKLSAAEHAARLEGELTSLYDDDQAIAIPDFQTTRGTWTLDGRAALGAALGHQIERVRPAVTRGRALACHQHRFRVHNAARGARPSIGIHRYTDADTAP